MKVTIYFHNDPSVGIFSCYYLMEIPQFEPEYREETRQMIKSIYTELDGEFTPIVTFEDETFD